MKMNLMQLLQGGNPYEIYYFENRKQMLIKELAKKNSEFLKEEYRHIVDVVKKIVHMKMHSNI